MRWSTIRLIWVRELRDQLRDRRTLFMVAGLPLLLYPVLGFAVLRFAVGFAARPSAIAVVGSPDDFPPRVPATLLATFQIAPAGPAGSGIRPDYLAGAVGLSTHPALSYPSLIAGGQFAPSDRLPSALRGIFESWTQKTELTFFDEADRALDDLGARKVDLVLSASPGFWSGLSPTSERRAWLEIRTRKGDDSSHLALQRLSVILEQWKHACKSVQLTRQGLPADYDEPFEIRDPLTAESLLSGGADLSTSLLLRIFPFLLVMWSLAGALYPAVDVCAGEKERGTMETLLISPTAREEIVLGKFLTIWVFSGVTALLNLASMGVTTWLYGDQLPTGGVSAGALAWCVLLMLPLSAMFSAVCLAIGAYARSSKEGQYYLMPLFLITMPLIFLTLAPGVELNSFYSMVPVTGVALLMQSLILAPSVGEVPWLYFLPVLAPVALYSWLALRWAIDLFQREDVLFREAERLDLRLWLQRLFREKELMPTVGQAVFCFGLLLGLRWLSLGIGGEMPLLLRSGVVLLAFVLAPPLFMGLLLTKRPRQSLNLRVPRLPYLLAAVLLLPLADLGYFVLSKYPKLQVLLETRQSWVLDAYERALETGVVPWEGYVFVLALLSAVSKEVAFRGFILNGLRQRFRPWTAVAISSFLFAAFHLNVFVLLPLFVLGLALGTLALKSESLLPGILLHLGCYILLVGGGPGEIDLAVRLGITAAGTALAGVFLWLAERLPGPRTTEGSLD